MVSTLQLVIVAALTLSLILQDIQQPLDPSSYGSDWWACVWTIGLATTIVKLSAYHVVLQTRREESQSTLSTALRCQLLDIRTKMHLAVWFCVVVVTMSSFRWPQFCSTMCGQLGAQHCLVLAPIVAWLILSWGMLYSAERFLDRSLESVSRSRYVLGQFRLFLAIPLCVLLFVVVFQDIIDVCGSAYLPAYIRVAPLVLVIIWFPSLLRLAWKTRSLPPGKLRTKLEGHCAQIGFRIRDILVWDTDHRIRNAAVSGMLPPWRYVLLSDRLLRDLTTDQIECVFFHEMAHSKRGHQRKLIALAILLVSIGAAIISISHPSESWLIAGRAIWLSVMALVGSIILIGRTARLFEMEADLWVVQNTNKSLEAYLKALVSISGIDTERRTWTHPSVRERSQFILQGDVAHAALKRKLTRNYWSLVLFLLTLSLAGLVL